MAVPTASSGNSKFLDLARAGRVTFIWVQTVTDHQAGTAQGAVPAVSIQGQSATRSFKSKISPSLRSVKNRCYCSKPGSFWIENGGIYHNSFRFDLAPSGADVFPVTNQNYQFEGLGFFSPYVIFSSHPTGMTTLMENLIIAGRQ
jgi:hypothetical protein